MSPSLLFTLATCLLFSLCLAQDGTGLVTASQPVDVDKAQLASLVQHNFITLTNTNCGYAMFAWNLVEGFKRVGLRNVLIITEDDLSYNYLKKVIPVVHLTRATSNRSSSRTALLPAKYGSRAFMKLTRVRGKYIRAILKEGYYVLWNDVDAAPLKNLEPFLPRGYDVGVTDDSPRASYNSGNFCSCFVFYKPSALTLAFVDSWLMLLLQPSRSHDQADFNKALRIAREASGLSMFLFPVHLFPNGQYFDAQAKTALWCHANFRVGRSAKRDFLQAHKAWFIHDNTTDLAITCPAQPILAAGTN